MATVPASQPSVTPPGESLQQRFQRLADTWHKAVAHHSSSRVRNNHPAYQEIIGLGNSVVPLLLRDLEQTGRHWFWALKVITGADPVPREDHGRIPKVTEAWLRWGQEHGYQW